MPLTMPLTMTHLTMAGIVLGIAAFLTWFFGLAVNLFKSIESWKTIFASSKKPTANDVKLVDMHPFELGRSAISRRDIAIVGVSAAGGFTLGELLRSHDHPHGITPEHISHDNTAGAILDSHDAVDDGQGIAGAIADTLDVLSA